VSKQAQAALDRRAFLKGVGLGAGVISLGTVAGTSEAAVLPKPARSDRFDVVVVGTGLAGLCAAMQAQSAGARVAVLDKMPEAQSGGNTRVAGGIFAVPADDTPKAKDEYFEDFMAKSQGKGNRELTRLLADHALEGIDWLRTQGAEFPAPIAVAGYRVKGAVAAPGLFAGVGRVLDSLKANVLKGGGVMVYETKAKQLVLDERGRVVAVRAADAQGLRDFVGSAIVLATGGYAGNAQFLETYVDPDADDMMVRGVKWATGDGHFLAQEAGAALVGMGGLAGLHIAAVSPRNTSSGNPFSSVALCLGINREGKRYVDESRGYVVHGKAVMKQPGQTVALVFDDQLRQQPGVIAAVQLFQRLKLDVHEGDSPEALAAKIGVPPAALARTIAEFNTHVKDGKAPGATPPKAAFAHALTGPKFYAFHPLVPGITLTFGSIRTNGKAQVVEADGRAIPGLYAAGECAGGLYYDDYIGGGSMVNCLVMGRIAGREAAAQKG
jgi:flavocytochrome c